MTAKLFKGLMVDIKVKEMRDNILGMPIYLAGSLTSKQIDTLCKELYFMGYPLTFKVRATKVVASIEFGNGFGLIPSDELVKELLNPYFM